jgi:hypothetical protein
MKTQQIISQKELFEILSQIDGKQPTFISLVAEVDARLKKTNNIYANSSVTKINKYTGTINYNYSNSVNYQRLREEKIADFRAGKGYASKINDDYNGCLATHDKTGQVYLVFKEQSTQKPTYKINGKEVDIDTESYLKQFRIEKRPSTSQGVEKQIEHRNIKLESIKLLNMNGVEYLVK